MGERALEGSAAGGALRVRPALRVERLTLGRGALAAVAVASAAGLTFGVHLPVLRHYFFGDDFVPLADVASRTTWQYLRDLFLMRDLTPNWRFLTGLVYLAEYRAFGLSAFPYLFANVLVHTATGALVFWLVRRATDSDWSGFLAAALFGVSAAHVPTVGQVTAFNNVLAGFLVMLSLVALYEGLERDRGRWWLAGSALAFLGAIAANESAAVLAPVPALLVVWRLAGPDGWWRARAAWRRVVLYSAPYALLGAGALLAFGACRCTEGASLYVYDTHLLDNLWLYLGRLLYPVGLEFPGHVALAHQVAGPVALALAALALARGPALARVSAVFLLLALLPYLPIEIWSAPRYTYLAAVPFSVLAALLFAEAARLGDRLTPALPAALALVAFGVLGLYGWQTWEQNQVLAGDSERWRTLVTGVEEALPELPDGSTVYVRGGPLTDPLIQCAVLPALGELLWGDTKLFTFPQGELKAYRVRPGYAVFVLDARGGAFVSADGEAPPRAADARLLPHVSPDASGNLCRLDVPLPP